MADIDATVRKAVERVIELVRAKLRDYASLNRLVSGEETSDKLIALEVWNTIDDWNTAPPLIGATSVVDFPSTAALIDGTVSRVLESVAILGNRNSVSYSDGRVSVNHAGKSSELLRIAAFFQQRYERVRDRTKPAINIASALGSCGVGSDYASVNFVEYF